jgi:hypothetical protein
MIIKPFTTEQILGTVSNVLSPAVFMIRLQLFLAVAFALAAKTVSDDQEPQQGRVLPIAPSENPSLKT